MDCLSAAQDNNTPQKQKEIDYMGNNLYRNMFDRATAIIPTQKIKYRIPTGKSVSASGRLTPVYSAWQTLKCVLEPGLVSSFASKNLSDKDYKRVGMDFSINSYTVWAKVDDIFPVRDGEAACQFQIFGKVYNVKQMEDWAMIDGWKRIYSELDYTATKAESVEYESDEDESV